MSYSTHTYGERGDQLSLNLNENLLLPEEYYERIRSEVGFKVAEYPSPTARGVKEALAEHYEMSPERFVVANGSDAVLDTLFKVVTGRGGSIASYTPSYELMDFFAKRNERRFIEIPLDSDFTVPTRTDFIDEVQAVMLCSPNNPTSLAVDKRTLIRLLELEVPVVVDEAYAEYAESDHLDLIKEYNNLILVRTFSKAWGLAGIRVGYSISSPEMAVKIEDVKLPFNVNSLSISAARSAIEQSALVERSVRETVEERERLLRDLNDLEFNCFPSQTNFIFCRPPPGVRPKELQSALVEEGISIRVFDGERTSDHVRITVGDHEMNDKLLDALNYIL